MLGVTFTDAPTALRAGSKKSSKKNKKEKKDKKDKREKKDKKHKHEKAAAATHSDSDGSGSGSGDESGSGEEGGHAERQPQEAPLQREGWMTDPSLARKRTAEQEREEQEAAEEEERKRKAAEEPELHVGLRIMRKGGGNPHDPSSVAAGGPGAAAVGPGTASGNGGRSDSGTGPAGASTSSAPPPGGGRPAGVVGDGGLSWRLKALKRAQEQATASGGSLGSIVAERWGSLSDLTASLTEGRAADGRAHVHAARDRERSASVSQSGSAGGGDRGAERTSSGQPRSHYLMQPGSERPAMRKPQMSESLSWRRDGDRDRDRDRDRGRDRDRDRDQSGPEAVSGERRRDDSGGAGDADRDKDRREGGGDRGSGRREDERRDDDRDRHRDHHHHRDRDRDRGREGDDDRRRDDRHSSRYSEGRASGSGAGWRQQRPPSGEQAAALSGLASHLNRFQSDGSFMDQFKPKEGAGDEERQQQGGGEEEDGGRGGAGGRPRSRLGIGAPPRQQSAATERRRQEEADRAEAMREEMRALRTGMGGGGEDGGGSGDEGAAAAGLEGPGQGLAEVEAVSDDEGGRQAAGGAHHSQHRGGRDAGMAEAEPEAPQPQGPSANKSVAEMLRAKLKGLPVPAPVPPGIPPRPPAHASLSAAARQGHNAEREHHGKHHHKHRHRGGDDQEGGQQGHSGSEGEGEEQGGGQRRKGREEVLLPQVDARGMAVRGALGREAAGTAVPNDGKGVKRVQRYEGGQKTRYFADDDKADLDTLVKRTKYGDDHDAALDATAMRNIMRTERFKTRDLDVDEEYDNDAGLELYEHRSRKGNAEQQAKRERDRQVAAYAKQQKLEDTCQYCPANPKRPRQLTISAGTCTYLMLPPRGRLVPGHCLIVPNDHVPSLRQVDDSVWTEVKNFIKCLIQMYGAQGKHCIFFETAMDLRGHRRHSVLECVPVGQRELDKAPGYYKKAMQEAESEWSTHHAKAVIETNAKKGLRESIPPNFPYVYVQFGYGQGYVHVIDDETKFDKEFARQVMVGLLRLPPEEMHRRHKLETPATQQEWAREFVGQWAPYDWTLQL